MTTLARRWQMLLFAALLGGVLSLAEIAAGSGSAVAATSFVIVVMYAFIVTSLERRSETMSALAGRPVDERWKFINEHALAFSAQIGTATALIGFTVTELQHRDSWQFATVAAVMGLSYIGGILLYRWRS